MFLVQLPGNKRCHGDDIDWQVGRQVGGATDRASSLQSADVNQMVMMRRSSSGMQIKKQEEHHTMRY